MYHEIRKVHPTLAEGIRFVDLERYELERLDSEKRTEKKRAV
jgi:hypothetical protein